MSTALNPAALAAETVLESAVVSLRISAGRNIARVPSGVSSGREVSGVELSGAEASGVELSLEDDSGALDEDSG